MWLLFSEVSFWNISTFGIIGNISRRLWCFNRLLFFCHWLFQLFIRNQSITSLFNLLFWNTCLKELIIKRLHNVLILQMFIMLNLKFYLCCLFIFFDFINFLIFVDFSSFLNNSRFVLVDIYIYDIIFVEFLRPSLRNSIFYLIFKLSDVWLPWKCLLYTLFMELIKFIIEFSNHLLDILSLFFLIELIYHSLLNFSLNKSLFITSRLSQSWC